MSIDCKLPMSEDDLKDAISFDWDAMSGKDYLDIYQLRGYYHSIGGKRGNNDLYCCPRNEKLSIENIKSFSGESCKWDINFSSNNYHRFKYDEHSIEHNYVLDIFRNNNIFYKLCSYNLSYLMAKSQVVLTQIEEHPIAFHFKNYPNQILGRKIYFKNCPARIESYSEGGNLIIYPDGTEQENELFRKYSFSIGEDYEGWIAEDLLAESINWFR